MSFNFLLLILSLSVLTSEHVNGARDLRNEQQVLRSHVVDDEDNKEMMMMMMHGHEHHHHAHDDNSYKNTLQMFFTINDLYPGKTMNTDFSQKIPSYYLSPKFLPKEISDKVPFSTNQLSNILKYFSYSPDSEQAKTMEASVKYCEAKPVRGETKVCATSLESMIDYARGVFGLGTQFKPLTTTHYTPSLATAQNYTVLESPKEVSAPNMERIGCHLMAYPYAVYYCHKQVGTKVLRVSLAGENGDRVNGVAVCHMDTSAWNPNHVAFEFLGIRPGPPVCHFFRPIDLLWVPASAN